MSNGHSPFGGRPSPFGYTGPSAPSSGPSPRGTGGGGALSIMSPGRTLQYDPPTPKDFIAIVAAWSKGIAWRRACKGLPPARIYWQSLDLIFLAEDRVIHPVDDITGYGATDSGPLDLAHLLWEKAKGYARILDDGARHSFAVRCYFADDEGRESFQEHPLLVQLPRDHSVSTGAGPGAMSRYGGAFSPQNRFQSAAPHITGQEIEVMSMGLGLVGQCVATLERRLDAADAVNARYQANEVAMFGLWRELQEDRVRQAREELWEKGKLEALKMLAGRLASVGPHIGLQLSNWLGSKMGGRARTEREELAFETLRRLVKRMKKNGADTPAKLRAELQKFGIDDDDEVMEDVRKLLLEFAVNEEKTKIERMMKGGGLLPNGDEKPAAKDERVTLEPAEEKAEATAEAPKSDDAKAPASAAPSPPPVSAAVSNVFAAIDAHLREFPDVAEEVQAVYTIRLTSPSSAWTIDAKTGSCAKRGITVDADATLELAEADFIAIVKGDADAAKLFMDGKIKAAGDLMAAQRLTFLQEVDLDGDEDEDEEDEG